MCTALYRSRVAITLLQMTIYYVFVLNLYFSDIGNFVWKAHKNST